MDNKKVPQLGQADDIKKVLEDKVTSKDEAGMLMGPSHPIFHQDELRNETARFDPISPVDPHGLGPDPDVEEVRRARWEMGPDGKPRKTSNLPHTPPSGGFSFRPPSFFK